MDPLIINVAITGMVPTKSDTPHVPITPDECIADARRCYEAGAAIVHIHARQPDGSPTYKGEIFRAIADGVRSQCPGMLVCASTSGRNFKTFEQRSDSLSCKPELATLTVGSLNFPRQASVNEPHMIEQLAAAMAERGIVPELEFFDLGMIDYARQYLARKGLIRPPFYGNILLGNRGTAAATPANLAYLVNALPEGATWSAAGIGRFQFAENTMAISMGGHVRVGLEDNIWFDDQRTRLATNPDLVERLVRIARTVGREPATPEQARHIIGIPSGSTQDAPQPQIPPLNPSEQRHV